MGILDVQPPRGLRVNECRICWLSALALDATATVADAGTSNKTEGTESAERASAENVSDSGSAALRNRDRLALNAGLAVRFRESDD